MRFRQAVTLAALLVCAACSTNFNSSAKTPDGKGFYTVGARTQAFGPVKPTIWECPAAGKGAECKELEVIEE